MGILGCLQSSRQPALVFIVHAAPLGVNNLRGGRDFGFDPVENRSYMLKNHGGRGIPKEVRGTISVGADHSDRLQVLLKWQKIVLVLQKDNALAGGLERQLLMFLRMHNALCLIQVNIWMLE